MIKTVEKIHGVKAKTRSIEFDRAALFGSDDPQEVVFHAFTPWFNELRESGLGWRNPSITTYESDTPGMVWVDIRVETAPLEPIVIAEEIPEPVGPLGLRSRTLHNLHRLNDINDAIASGVQHLAPIPEEWLDERDDLLRILEME